MIEAKRSGTEWTRQRQYLGDIFVFVVQASFMHSCNWSRILKRGLMVATSFFNLLHAFSIGLQSRGLPGHSSTVISYESSHWGTILAWWHEAPSCSRLRYVALFIVFPLGRKNRPPPLLQLMDHILGIVSFGDRTTNSKLTGTKLSEEHSSVHITLSDCSTVQWTYFIAKASLFVIIASVNLHLTFFAGRWLLRPKSFESRRLNMIALTVLPAASSPWTNSGRLA